MTEPRPVPADDAGDVPLSVLGVRVELPEQHHVILLVDPPGRTMVPRTGPPFVLNSTAGLQRGRRHGGEEVAQGSQELALVRAR